MSQDINLQNNNLTNGYIYKTLVNRIDELEKKFTGILTDIEKAKNDLTISVKDYVKIIEIVENNVTRDEFIRHIEDKEVHYNHSQTLK